MGTVMVFAPDTIDKHPLESTTLGKIGLNFVFMALIIDAIIVGGQGEGKHSTAGGLTIILGAIGMVLGLAGAIAAAASPAPLKYAGYILNGLLVMFAFFAMSVGFAELEEV